MRIITIDDFIDTYFKLIQRGSKFILSKFTFDNEKRTKSAFDNSSFTSSYFWNIPKVQERWNILITGDKNRNYIDYLTDEFLKEKSNLYMLSLGSGMSNREIELAAKTSSFKEIVCVDIAENLLEIAKKDAREQGVENVKFLAKNIDDFDFKENSYDIVFFKSSLHHFDNIDEFLLKKIKQVLKPNGYLIINEFVGATRHQFSKEQINQINRVIN